MSATLRVFFLCLVLSGTSFSAAQTIEGKTSGNLTVTVGEGVVLDFPGDVVRVLTSSPEVIDPVAVTNREILLNAKSPGLATVIVWMKDGQRTIRSVLVNSNLESMRQLVKETFPNEKIEVKAARDSLSLVGRVSSQVVVDRAIALLAPSVKGVVSNLEVVPPRGDKQIVLKVLFAEVNRNVASSFGFNLLSTGAANTPGRLSTGQFSPGNASEVKGVIGGQLAGSSTTFSLADALNVFAFRPDLNLAATIRALQTQGLLQILAEPNLVTTDGKEANFVVGGEFPIPIVQGGATSGAITVQFREFGIRLNFLPRVTANDTIKLHVKPEVSTIDMANAVVISGFNIPALATRKMETDIELREGQSFVIAGLLDDRVLANLAKIPGLANIPLIGALFKSRNIVKSKTELVVIVTPESTFPLEPGERKPIPVMPEKFLAPITPEKSGAVRKGAK